MKYYEDDYKEVEQPVVQEELFGCGYCWDKKKKINKELFFLDRANNMRVCSFCPNCGRELREEQ